MRRYLRVRPLFINSPAVCRLKTKGFQTLSCADAIFPLFVYKKNQKKKPTTQIWLCILLLWATQPRGNTNEVLFLPTGCSCETYELFLSCWWVMRERKIKDCHIAFSSSQAECCFINSWTASAATAMSFASSAFHIRRSITLDMSANCCTVSVRLPFRDEHTFASDLS